MNTLQGSLALLNDPLAQELLKGKVLARLAYIWPDGTPRVVPIIFHWNGQQIVVASPHDAPKVKALAQNPKVALTIDTEGIPAKVLMIRGTAAVEIVAESPEYTAACISYMGEEEGVGWSAQAHGLISQWARVNITPEWVGIIDFEQRLPSALARAMAKAMAI